jgi:UDP-hydrolysing UDP-N-acetyl-D-glucosamine 2-epimerase
MKTVCVVIGSRANYASIKSAMRCIQASPELELKIVFFSSAVLRNYGDLVKQIQDDGFNIDEMLNTHLELSSPSSMAQSTGVALLKIPEALERLKPDVVVTVGDRYETLATAISASYMNIALAHTMGGELSGTIDESIRHAITKLSNVHFVATFQAKRVLEQLGEDPQAIYVTGCPRIDIAKEASSMTLEVLREKCSSFGTGDEIDFSSDFLLVSQHPVTTEFNQSVKQIRVTLEALDDLRLQTIVLWPNSDAGSQAITKEMRNWQEKRKSFAVRFYRNLPPELYLKILSITRCLIGNSSSGIREGAYFGTPVVNVGSRQTGREKSTNVVSVSTNSQELVEAVHKQLSCTRPQPSTLYGDGSAGLQIANVLSAFSLGTTQKFLRLL